MQAGSLINGDIAMQRRSCWLGVACVFKCKVHRELVPGMHRHSPGFKLRDHVRVRFMVNVRHVYTQHLFAVRAQSGEGDAADLKIHLWGPDQRLF